MRGTSLLTEVKYRHPTRKWPFRPIEKSISFWNKMISAKSCIWSNTRSSSNLRHRVRGGNSENLYSSTVGQPPFPDRSLTPDCPRLPPLASCVHFINLTNGLEALPLLMNAGLHHHCGYIRIQSTYCEQGHLEKLISELDSSLLLHLALGHCCLVYDFGSRNKKRGAPRAIWYGLEFIRYALARSWDLPLLGDKVGTGGGQRAYLRGHDASKSFEAHISQFSQSTRRRLRYFSNYMPSDGLTSIQLYGVYKATEHDVDFDYYRQIAQSYVRNDEMENSSASSLVYNKDTSLAVQKLFGMHLFLGGLSHKERQAYIAN